MTLNDHCAIQKPHLFFLPDVPSVPFFPRDAHRHDIEVLEASFPAILDEFKAVYQRGIDPKQGWTYAGPKVNKSFILIVSMTSLRGILHIDCRPLCPSGPGSVSPVQRRRLCGRKLSLVPSHLPDASLSPNIYKQQLVGFCRILAAGSWSFTGEFVRSHQCTSALSPW